MVHFGRNLRNNSCFGSRSDGSVQSEESGIATHDFDKEKSFVGRCGIAYFIDGIHNGVQCRIVSDRGVGSIEIVVYRSRQSYDGIVVFGGENARTGQCSVSSDYDKGIYAFFDECVVSDFSSFGRFEFLTAGCLQYRTSQLYDVTYILRFERGYFSRNQTFITSINTFYLESVVDGCTSYRANGRIHSGSIATGS